jgi:hypothetical protein
MVRDGPRRWLWRREGSHESTEEFKEQGARAVKCAVVGVPILCGTEWALSPEIIVVRALNHSWWIAQPPGIAAWFCGLLPDRTENRVPNFHGSLEFPTFLPFTGWLSVESAETSKQNAFFLLLYIQCRTQCSVCFPTLIHLEDTASLGHLLLLGE